MLCSVAAAQPQFPLRIIAESQDDYAAEEVGGCTGGPVTIDPARKIIWYC